MAIYQKPHALEDISMHFCPGCTHGIVHRLVAEVIDEMGIEGDTIGIIIIMQRLYILIGYFNMHAL